MAPVFVGFGFMAKLKLLIDVIIVLFFLLVGLAFTLRNDSVIVLDLLFARIENAHLGFLITLSFCLGGIVGLIVRVPGLYKLRLTQRHHERKIKRQQNEILQLKGESAKGN